ncbi:MAG: (Fe-S)-binding protein [Actinomycetia bacterium]|nr:(Fe-S)-binding protein [Actinomycetes bacterium]
MEIEKNIEILKACRYCPMCRHVCTSGNISFHESDYPRGRGLILDKIFEGRIEYTPDLSDTIYNCCLCGLCWSNCEGGYKPHKLILTAREDIVNQNRIPGAVLEIVEKIESGRNPYAGSSEVYKGKEKNADILYYMGDYVKFNSHSIAESVMKILKKAGASYSIFKNEQTDGKILSLLGFTAKARDMAKKLYQRIMDLNPGTILVSDPLSYDSFKNDFPAYGIKLKTRVLHISQYLADLIKKKKLKVKQLNEKVTLADSEFLGRFNQVFDAPRKVLKAVAGNNIIEMKNNKEMALATGEAAIIFNGKISMVGNIIGSRICKEAADAGARTIITLSGVARRNMKDCREMDVFEISEFICQNIL